MTTGLGRLPQEDHDVLPIPFMGCLPIVVEVDKPVLYGDEPSIRRRVIPSREHAYRVVAINEVDVGTMGILPIILVDTLFIHDAVVLFPHLLTPDRESALMENDPFRLILQIVE